MKIRMIRTESDYEEACNRIYELIHSSDDPVEPNTSEGDELELLSLIVEKYEKEHHSIGVPDPIDAIKFRMDQMNLRQKDIAPLFGGITRVSEVLNGKRALSLKMIVLINRYLGIPLESLVEGSKTVKLDQGEKQKILKVPAISNLMKVNEQKGKYNKGTD